MADDVRATKAMLRAAAEIADVPVQRIPPGKRGLRRGELSERGGRPRNTSHIYPARVAHDPERAPDDKIRATRQPHRKQLPPDYRGSTEAESAFGRMYLQGLLDDDRSSITATERYRAGLMFAVVVGRYRAVIGTPRGTAGGGRGFTCMLGDPQEKQVRFVGEIMTVRSGRCWDDTKNCECRQRADDYNDAYEALARMGQRAAKAVSRAAVHGEELPPEHRVYLNRGLDALALHFGLTD